MNDDCIYWDPRLRQSGGEVPGLSAAALPAVAGHPVQSLFFSLDPWAIFSVIFYSASVMLLWAGLVFFAIRLATAEFAPQPLYVCRIEAVRSNSNWFNLTSTTTVNAHRCQAYDISFDEQLPNKQGLLFVNLPNEGPICLAITSNDPAEDCADETNSFVVDWSTAPTGTRVEPDDLVSQDACVYFGDARPAKTILEPIDKDYE